MHNQVIVQFLLINGQQESYSLHQKQEVFFNPLLGQGGKKITDEKLGKQSPTTAKKKWHLNFITERRKAQDLWAIVTAMHRLLLQSVKSFQWKAP